LIVRAFVLASPRALIAVALGLMVGCAPRSVPRPLVRANGAVISALHFPGRREIVIPLTSRNGILGTDAVTINGRSAGWFVVDTGASWTAIDREAAKALGLLANEPWAPIDKTKKPDGLYPIDRLEVGGMALSNHEIAVLDFSSLAALPGGRIAGSIGGDVWGSLPFTIDYAKRQLVIHRRDEFSRLAVRPHSR
jgi:hypothetical protein